MMRTDIPWGGVIGNNMLYVLSRLFLFFSFFFVSLVGSLAIAIIFFSGHASGVLVLIWLPCHHPIWRVLVHTEPWPSLSGKKH